VQDGGRKSGWEWWWERVNGRRCVCGRIEVRDEAVLLAVGQLGPWLSVDVGAWGCVRLCGPVAKWWWGEKVVGGGGGSLKRPHKREAMWGATHAAPARHAASSARMGMYSRQRRRECARGA
jgi:hypothetical protein